jgi:hypothetical protein
VHRRPNITFDQRVASRTTSPDFLEGVAWVRRTLHAFDSLPSARGWLTRYLRMKGAESPPLPVPARQRLLSTQARKKGKVAPGVILRQFWLELLERGLTLEQIGHFFNREKQTIRLGILKAKSLRDASRRLRG